MPGTTVLAETPPRIEFGDVEVPMNGFIPTPPRGTHLPILAQRTSGAKGEKEGHKPKSTDCYMQPKNQREKREGKGKGK